MKKKNKTKTKVVKTKHCVSFGEIKKSKRIIDDGSLFLFTLTCSCGFIGVGTNWMEAGEDFDIHIYNISL